MKLFIGCYTKKISEELVGKGEGIYCFDLDEETGALELKSVCKAINPSYLALSHDNLFLYAPEELPLKESPRIGAYRIDDFELAPINYQPLSGSYACHLEVLNDETTIVVASYMSGSILSYPTRKNGGLDACQQLIQHHDKGSNQARQEAHVHMIYPKADGFYAVDLGLDKAVAYKFQKDEIVSVPNGNLSITPGSGARHMVLSPSGQHAFIFGELDAHIHVFELVDAQFEARGSVPSLPASYSDTPSGAAIRVHPSGKFLYVSNRGYDHITVFRFDAVTCRLQLIGYDHSGGRTPREINIAPSGYWLVCANQDSDNLVVFAIDQADGSLTKASVNNQVKTACCIQFAHH